jgi:hypothetical protein
MFYSKTKEDKGETKKQDETLLHGAHQQSLTSNI